MSTKPRLTLLLATLAGLLFAGNSLALNPQPEPPMSKSKNQLVRPGPDARFSGQQSIKGPVVTNPGTRQFARR
jgi:hypothetical protein